MCVKRIKTKVNLELCFVGGYIFDNIFRFYDELPTRFVIEPSKNIVSQFYYITKVSHPQKVGLK